jgi:hypothetical protein
VLQQPRVQQPGRGYKAVYGQGQKLHLQRMPGWAILWEGLPEGALEAAQASVQDAAGYS